jgi:hypothetical protein
MKRQLPWLIAMPLAVVGTLAGHAVGYWAAVPDADERAHVLAASGHAYLSYAPLLIGLCLAVTALGFVAQALAVFRGSDASGGTRIKLVAAVAPAAFVLQELLERYVHDGHLHWHLVVSAPFLLGLATQVPFALLAAAIAFALTTAAQHVAQAIKAARRPRPRGTALTFLSWLSIDLPPAPVLARGYAGRGPPLLL